MKPFYPQGDSVGYAMGAKAEIDLYLSGFFNPIYKAPKPPILIPVIDCLLRSTGKCYCMTSGNSLVIYEYILKWPLYLSTVASR